MRHVLRQFLCAVVAVIIGVSGLLPALPAHAASLAAERASVTGKGVLTMQPGEVQEITASFTNTGMSTWKNDGPGYISLYTYEPKYRKSAFDPGTWLGPTQVKRIREASVAPGGTGTLVFQLRAPATEGTYTEVFQLASENIAWMNGGKLSLTINVKAVREAENSGDLVSEEGISAKLAMQSANSVRLVAGKSVLLTAGFTNMGSATWTNYGLRTPSVSMASATSATAFTHPSWSGSQLAYADTAKVAPGETAYVTFSIKAPQVNGTHTARFQFAANDIAVDDAFVEIPVTVTGGAAEALVAEEVVEVDEYLIDEPIIRVGVLIIDEETDHETVITSFASDYELRDTNGNLLGEMAKGDEVVTYYDGARYVYDRGNGKEYSSTPLRFVPETENAVMTITNFDRRATRGASNADNTFRGVLEFRHNDHKDRAWIINELPMEYYLRGLAETSDVSHMEFHKALLTAARTYAFYHWTHATKHAKEYFHVDAYADQVYKGYGQEERTPRITQAINATRGQIVTYEGETAITAYFSRSAGRTLDWSDVWNGNVPWSKSVPVPCDEGKTLWGHGVGMSASGALCMANGGMSYDDILKYFYTGIELDTLWE